MKANYVQRLRLTFTKEGPARYIGHLDLAKTLERTFIRALIPVAYTQGFNPRPRMQLADALPLGYTSECELVDIWLLELMAPAVLLRQLESKMAPGVEVVDAIEMPIGGASLPSLVLEATYRVRLLENDEAAEISERIAALMLSDQIIRSGRGKEYDLRSRVFELLLIPDDDQPSAVRNTLVMRLDTRPGSTTRPDVVLENLGIDPLDVHVHRTALRVAEGEPVEEA